MIISMIGSVIKQDHDSNHRYYFGYNIYALIESTVLFCLKLCSVTVLKIKITDKDNIVE